jgi:hypothetical protein
LSTQKRLDDVLLRHNNTIDHTLNDVFDAVNEITQGLQSDAHRCTLEVVRCPKEILQGIVIRRIAEKKDRLLEALQGIEDIVHETTEKLLI